jgi:hypothetical protein
VKQKKWEKHALSMMTGSSTPYLMRMSWKIYPIESTGTGRVKVLVNVGNHFETFAIKLRILNKQVRKGRFHLVIELGCHTKAMKMTKELDY